LNAFCFFSLCVILFTKQGEHEKEKLVMKLLAKDSKYLSEKRVKFLYVYVDVQRGLIAEFKDGKKDDKCADNSTASKVNGELVIFEQINTCDLSGTPFVSNVISLLYLVSMISTLHSLPCLASPLLSSPYWF